MKVITFPFIFCISLWTIHIESYHTNPPRVSRREAIASGLATAFLPIVGTNAATDCMIDCVKNCKLIAPKDPEYCQDNCKSYCDQPDRTDGLSGSISSTGGETGILGTSTVVKGEDKPPTIKLPGLDFSSGPGKKLLGY